MICETLPRSQVDCQACPAPRVAKASLSAVFILANLELFQDDNIRQSLLLS